MVEPSIRPDLGSNEAAAVAEGEPGRFGLESEARRQSALAVMKEIHRPDPNDKKHGIGFAARRTRTLSGQRPWTEKGVLDAVTELSDGFERIAHEVALGGYFTLNGILPFSQPGGTKGAERVPTMHWDPELAALGLRRPSRKEKYLTRLTGIAIDFDCYKPGLDLDPDMVRALVDKSMRALGLPVGVWILASGLRAIILLEAEDSTGPIKATRGATGTIAEYRLWANAILEHLEEAGRKEGFPSLGIDYGCSADVMAALRLPESLSTKNYKRVGYVLNKDAGKTICHKPSVMRKRLGIPKPERNKWKPYASGIARTLGHVDNPTAPQEIRDANATGSMIHSLRVLRGIESLFDNRPASSIREGHRHHACLEYAQWLCRARFAAQFALGRELQNLPMVESLFEEDELAAIAGWTPPQIRDRVLGYATQNCAPDMSAPKGKRAFIPLQEAKKNVSWAVGKRRPALLLLSTRNMADRFGVTVPEAEAVAAEFGGRPWPVQGALTPRARAAADRRESIRAIVEEAWGQVPTLRELRDRLTDSDGKAPGLKTIAADLRALGFRK